MLIGSALTSVLGQVIKACRNPKNEKVRQVLGLPSKIDESSREALETVFQDMDEVSFG
jgi:hypothetical protein